MTANVESMMYIENTPWHGLGKRLDKAANADEALKESGLNWDVRLGGVYGKHDGETFDIPRYQGVYRSSDQRCLGIVQGRYQPIQNRELFDFMDALVEVGGAHYHTAGSLNNGSRVWGLIRMPETIKVKADLTETYMLGMSAHDGTCPMKVLYTSIRVVCQNTMQMALKGANAGVSIRHTRTAVDRMIEAQKVLGRSQQYFDKFAEMAKFLSSKRMTVAELKTFVDQLFPQPQGQTEDDISTRLQTKRDNVIYLFDHGKGHDKAGVKGTAWAALNAVTEFADYAYGRKERTLEKKAESVIYGSSSLLKQRAVDTLLRLVA